MTENIQAIETLSHIATNAVALRRQSMDRVLRRAVAKCIHTKQTEELETELAEVIAPVFREAIEEMAGRLEQISGAGLMKNTSDQAGVLAQQIASPKQWHHDLIDAMLPVMGVKMIEAAVAELLSSGIDVRRPDRKDFLLEGQKHLPGQHDQGSHGGGVSGVVLGEFAETKRDSAGNLTLADGKSLPKHTPYIPLAWSNVQVNLDANADRLVIGTDAKGRQQSVYSKSWKTKQAAAKFAKISELTKKMGQLKREVHEDMKSSDPKTREDATCLALILETGIRPGSSRDTGAAKQAYGATTLEARHVRVVKGGVNLNYTGKKGVKRNVSVRDKLVVDELKKRKQSAKKSTDKIFKTNSNRFNAYTKTKDGGDFTPRDFRTARGTSIALDRVKKMAPPKTQKEYKKRVREVGNIVAKQLGNTRTIALQSYVDPMVFSEWADAVGME